MKLIRPLITLIDQIRSIHSQIPQQLYDQLRKDSGHLRTTIDQITEKLRSELAKLNPTITPNPKSEEIKPSNNQKTTEISRQLKFGTKENLKILMMM